MRARPSAARSAFGQTSHIEDAVGRARSRNNRNEDGRPYIGITLRIPARREVPSPSRPPVIDRPAAEFLHGNGRALASGRLRNPGRRLKIVQVGRCALSVRGGRENEALLVGEHLEPGREVTGVVRPGLELRYDAEIGAEENRPQFGDQLLATAFATILVVAAEIAVDPVGRSCPVALMPISA